jgi:hypothetical protein
VDQTIIINPVLFIELLNNHKGPLPGRLSLIPFPNSLVVGKRQLIGNLIVRLGKLRRSYFNLHPFGNRGSTRIRRLTF